MCVCVCTYLRFGLYFVLFGALRSAILFHEDSVLKMKIEKIHHYSFFHYFS